MEAEPKNLITKLVLGAKIRGLSLNKKLKLRGTMCLPPKLAYTELSSAFIYLFYQADNPEGVVFPIIQVVIVSLVFPARTLVLDSGGHYRVLLVQVHADQL